VAYHLGPVDPDRRAELFADTRDEEFQPRPRRLLTTALGLLVMALFGGGLWFAYIHQTRYSGGDVPGDQVPLIRADERPTKVKPEQPGGMEIPDRDKLIYNPSRKVVEHLLPPPEKPMPRPAPPPPAQVQAEAARSPTGTAPTMPAAPENPPAAAQTAQAQQQAAAAPHQAVQVPPQPTKP